MAFIWVLAAGVPISYRCKPSSQRELDTGVQTNTLHIMQQSKENELIPRRKKICRENSLPMEKRRLVVVSSLVAFLFLTPIRLSYVLHHQIVIGNHRTEGVGIESLRHLALNAPCRSHLIFVSFEQQVHEFGRVKRLVIQPIYLAPSHRSYANPPSPPYQ